MSEPKKYRKKPVEIEAIQYTGDNWSHVAKFCGERFYMTGAENRIAIRSLEGVVYAQEGDYIIRGVQGEFYPCKPDIFAKTYELVDTSPLPYNAVCYDIPGEGNMP